MTPAVSATIQICLGDRLSIRFDHLSVTVFEQPMDVLACVVRGLART